MQTKSIIMILLRFVVFSTSAVAGASNETCPECVTLEGGMAKGVIEDGILSLKGIPYAAPPVSELRFRPPSLPNHWQGILPAANYRTICPQIEDPLESYPKAAMAHEVVVGGVTTRLFEDEDCLYLNVWKPAKQVRNLPIMIYLPGGGFIAGGASDVYNGAAVARKDVVVVTINYRIGLLGFAELGALDPSYSGSGNNGLRDQIAALEWVRRNATALGGDSDNVTVFGESAGSISIAAHLVSPSLKKPFQRAILQSGAYNLIRTRRSAEATVKKVMDVGSLKTMAQIKTAPVRDLLLQAQATGEPDGFFAPVADGSWVALDPAEAFASGTSRHVGIMLGTNANEMNYWAMYDSKFRNPYVEDTDLGAKIDVFSMLPSIGNTSEAKREKVKRKLLSTYEKVLGTTDQRTIEAALVDDVIMTQPATHLAERQSASGGKVWLYRFTWHVPPKYLDPALPALGAFHSIELPFMFGTGDFSQIPGGLALSKAPGPEISRLANQMLTAWTNFAKKGDPNGAGVPEWPSYDTNKRVVMVWSADSEAVADPDRSRREIWERWHFNPY